MSEREVVEVSRDPELLKHGTDGVDGQLDLNVGGLEHTTHLLAQRARLPGHDGGDDRVPAATAVVKGALHGAADERPDADGATSPDVVGEDRTVHGRIEQVAHLSRTVTTLGQGKDMAFFALDKGQKSDHLVLEARRDLTRHVDSSRTSVAEGKGQVWADHLDREERILRVDDVMEIEEGESIGEGGNEARRVGRDVCRRRRRRGRAAALRAGMKPVLVSASRLILGGGLLTPAFLQGSRRRQRRRAREKCWVDDVVRMF